MKSILSAITITLIFSLNAHRALANESNDQAAPFEENDSTCRGYGCDDGYRYDENEEPEYSYEDPRFEEGENYHETEGDDSNL